MLVLFSWFSGGWSSYDRLQTVPFSYASTGPGDFFILWHRECPDRQTPQKQYCVLKSQNMGVQQEDQKIVFPSLFLRKIWKISAFWYPLGETKENILQATFLLLKVPLAIMRWVWLTDCRIQVSDKEPDKIEVSRSDVSESVQMSSEFRYTGLLSWEMLW